MAMNMHKKITIKPNDTIIFSSSPIPGNEKAVSRIINELEEKGTTVIFQDTHVSGHACREEIKLIYSLVKPKYAIPIHGEFRHRMAQASIVKELGYDDEHILMMHSGDVVEMNMESCKTVKHVPTGSVFVDGSGVGDVGNIVLRDRKHLAEDGIVIIVLTLQRGTGQILAGPDIVSRGFVYVRESDALLEDSTEILRDIMDELADRGVSDWSKIKSSLKDGLSDYLWKKTKRRPMILPIIMEV